MAVQPQQTTQEQDSLPVTVDALAAAVVVVYAQGEQDLIAQSGQFIREALQSPLDAPPRFLLYSRLRRAADQVSAGIRMQVASLAYRVADTAARNGNATAAREVRKYAEKYRLSGNVLDLLPHNVNSARMIADDLSKRLDAAAVRITRFADDAYRAAVVSGAVTQALDNATPFEASAQAWRELSARGVKGFTDKSGRNWDLASYVEMATRTATQRAYNASHRDRLTQAGINYFTISTTGRPCVLCAPWEGKVLADRGAGIATEPSATDSTQTVTFAVSATIEEATAAGLFHPNCFPGEVLVTAPTGVRAADSRWYEGDVVIINTASGNELTVTPNHPVLTPEGWVAAGKLMVGGNVLSYGGDVERVDGMRPDDELVPTPISDVFDSLAQSGAVLSMSVPASAEQFHGDGEGSDVKVVFARGFLEDDRIDAEAFDGLGDDPFFAGGMGFPDLLGTGTFDEVTLATGHTSDSVVGGVSDFGALCGRHARIAAVSSLSAGDVGTLPLEQVTDGPLLDSESVSDLLLSLTGLVTADHIVNIRTREFAGHVYNLQSGGGWYVANSIVVHNCKHVLTSYLPGVTTLRSNGWTAEDEQAYKNTQQLRALENAVRKAKQQALGAATDLDKRRANARVRDLQARIRAHTAATGLLRRPGREQLSLGYKP